MEQQRLHIEDVDMNEFMLTPAKITLIGNHYDILYRKQPFYMQSPVCRVLEFDKDNNRVKLYFYRTHNSDYYEFFCKLNDLFFRHMESNHAGLQFIYSVSCETTRVVISAKLNPKILYFDKNKSIAISSDINVGDVVICLMNTKGVWVNEDTGTMKWNIFQMLNLSS